MIQVLWVPPRSRGSWDMGVVEELTAGSEFCHNPPLCPPSEFPGAIVVLAGQHCVEVADLYAEQIARLPWALTIVTSDEEALFPVELLPRDERHVTWGQYHARPEFERVIPIGAAPGTAEILEKIGPVARMGDVFFAGQDTHERRHELLAVMKEMACDTKRYGNVTWATTTGFREGLSQERYLAGMRDTRIAPCPSGPHSLDSFRLYEALAARCLPIVETTTPHGDEWEFWRALFGEMCPIPQVDSWQALPLIAEQLRSGVGWQAKRDEVARWFQGYREDLAIDFERTIARLRKG